jgi:hypothetical protein
VLQVAVFEAVNAVERRYVPYKLNLPSDKTASTEAAAAAAAHAVLLSFFPEERTKLDASLASSLARVVDGQPKTNGIELGRRAAAELLARRAKDSAKAPDTYRPHAAPGVYVPTVIPVGVTFGGITPWSMESGAQFRPPAPPPLGSDAWTRDLNEICEIGGLNSTKRTAEQTNIGRLWLITGPPSWNPVVRELVRLKPLDLADTARLFALVAMATDDAYIAVFDAKYHYNLWRPVTQHGKSGHPARRSMAAVGRDADAPGVPLRTLHHIRSRGRCPEKRVRQFDTGGDNDEPDGSRRNTHVDPHRRLRRRDRHGAHLCRLPLPLVDSSRRGDGTQDR